MHHPTRSASLDDPAAIRHASADWLALALMDSRNALLAALPDDDTLAASLVLRRLVLQAGTWPEWWLSRHVQRGRGARADLRSPRLPGVQPRVDDWCLGEEVPSGDDIRHYLAQTLELTLELLATTAPDDEAMHLFRQALQQEDRLLERLHETLREGASPPRPERPPLWVAARRATLGSGREGGGFVPASDAPASTQAVPEFEIDAQVVNWARFAEFANDGGYDRDELWCAAGRAWRDSGGRRAPAFVEQLVGGVRVLRGFGRRQQVQHAPMQQAAAHLTRFEAEAWCRWAGRRLPAAAEWELAARTQVRLGFAWGDVHEWVLGSALRQTELDDKGPAWPASALDTPSRGHGVLCGASWATPPRWHHAPARRFADPASELLCAGFRSCAL